MIRGTIPKWFLRRTRERLGIAIPILCCHRWNILFDHIGTVILPDGQQALVAEPYLPEPVAREMAESFSVEIGCDWLVSCPGQWHVKTSRVVFRLKSAP